jgi:hypothetical protein
MAPHLPELYPLPLQPHACPVDEQQADRDGGQDQQLKSVFMGCPFKVPVLQMRVIER